MRLDSVSGFTLQPNSTFAAVGSRQAGLNGCQCGTCAQCGGARSIGATAEPAATFELASPGNEKVTESNAGRAGQSLTPEEQQEVEELKKRDAEVKQHEQAHLAAAGPYALGGPTYEYKTGPDGQRYAVGGEVRIDTTPIPNDPEATIQKAQTVKKAALAPSDPSGQDYKIAAEADQMEAEARQELAVQAAEAYRQAGQLQTASENHLKLLV